MTTAGRFASVRQRLVDGWQLCATAPGRYGSPEELVGESSWLGISEPTTAAAALRALERWSLDGPARRFDAEDWWYRTDFTVAAFEPGTNWWLGFDGLAGVADVWLNGVHLLQSTNMFVAAEREVGTLLRPGSNALVIRFPSLDTELAKRRSRPRWRAPMVEHQQLRWFRTTLLGRTPGWSPPAAPVGPWKDVWLEHRQGMHLESLRWTAHVEGTGGLLEVDALFSGSTTARADVVIELQREGRHCEAVLTPDPARPGRFRGRLPVPNVLLWWPHTHGEPVRYDASLRISVPGSSESFAWPLRPIGFRSLRVDTAGGDFRLDVNDEPVFCRGACWSPLDVVSLRHTPEACRQAVTQARDAGMNMLRIPGTLVYEDDAFFDACDELGVLVWQDFMFANMDYPEGDADFVASVEAEAAQQLARWQGHASLAVVCGNSEVEQQAAMWGAPREVWHPSLFHHTLAERVHAALPGVVYWPSSAHGGAFPHQPCAGTTSYYGVGAYLRPQDDARRSDLRFATECLAFAHVPDDSTIRRMPGGESLRVHHPGWKARAPRDLGAGWDFEDVRDHYLVERFGTDALKSRLSEHDRYLALSRAITGELMTAAFAEWRRPASRCGGALVLMLRDLWAGAGWGLLDERGHPKPCFFPLARALQPLSLAITDEGVNGLAAHLVNERPEPFAGTLAVDAYGPGDALVAQTRRPVQLDRRDAQTVMLAEDLMHLLDLSYAYRFGPPPVIVVHARLEDASQGLVAEAFFVPSGSTATQRIDVGLTAEVLREVDGADVLLLRSARFAHTVHIELDGHVPDDNQFHIAPGASRRVRLVARGGFVSTIKGQVSALNSLASVHLHHNA
ncbi:MAG: glycoside hydrolase family 2 protein [Rhizobacter sp.]